MSLAFYAPLKSPDHPTPSGDRRMARALIEALRRTGKQVEIACRLRSYDRTGDLSRQQRLQALGELCAENLLRRYRRERPQAWLTYHGYHKAPDWLGPAVSAALRIPYLMIEASFAPKQATGPWALGHRATGWALRQADVVIGLTAVDLECLAPLVEPPAQLRHLPPFLDPAPYAAARSARDRHRADIAARFAMDSCRPWRSARDRHRADIAARFAMDSCRPWLLTVAMMRADVKRDSYLLLAEALGHIADRPWQILLVGDGPARSEIEAAFARLGARAVVAGSLPEADLPTVYAACDLFVWPAVREAYGLAMLEAQAAGLPVVAGREGGVAEVVQHGTTGILTPPREPQAFAEAIGALLADPSRRHAMRDAALRFVAEQRSIDGAAKALDAALRDALTIRATRS